MHQTIIKLERVHVLQKKIIRWRISLIKKLNKKNNYRVEFNKFYVISGQLLFDKGTYYEIKIIKLEKPV